MFKYAVIIDSHRYWLLRKWDDALPTVVFVMLSPSSANAEHDDPVTRKCIEYAKKWGYGSLEIVNLFSYLCLDAEELRTLPVHTTVGPQNHFFMKRALKNADCIVVAWGENGCYQEQSKHPELLALLQENRDKVYCFGKCKSNNEPQHLARLPYSKPLQLFFKKEPIKLKRTVDNVFSSKEGLLVDDHGHVVGGDSWMWCEMCHSEFPIAGHTVCGNCLEELEKREG